MQTSTVSELPHGSFASTGFPNNAGSEDPSLFTARILNLYSLL